MRNLRAILFVLCLAPFSLAWGYEKEKTELVDVLKDFETILMTEKNASLARDLCNKLEKDLAKMDTIRQTAEKEGKPLPPIAILADLALQLQMINVQMQLDSQRLQALINSPDPNAEDAPYRQYRFRVKRDDKSKMWKVVEKK